MEKSFVLVANWQWKNAQKVRHLSLLGAEKVKLIPELWEQKGGPNVQYRLTK